MTHRGISPLLIAADAYFDGAPRTDAEAHETGAFTLFVSKTPWAYYARPVRSHSQALSRDDIEVLAAMCKERKVDLVLEWVHELHPELAELATTFGLDVTSHALMTLDANEPVQAPAVDAVMRVVDADDPALLQARAVAAVSFGTGGTAIGPAGAARRELAARTLAPKLAEHLRDRAHRGLTVTAVAETSDGVVAAASYQPVGKTAEVLSVATLPVVRRQGLAASVTAKLAQHARESGVRLLLLSAQNDDVARVYSRIGFRRIGMVCAAEPPRA